LFLSSMTHTNHISLFFPYTTLFRSVILEISDREQHRIGQELHDGLCQHLTAVAFMTRAVALRLKNHRVIEVEDLEKIAELVNQRSEEHTSELQSPDQSRMPSSA